MTRELLNFIDKITNLTEIGDNIIVDEKLEYSIPQMGRALYYHGQRQGKKFSRVKTPNGYFVTLVAFRQKNTLTKKTVKAEIE